MKVRLGDVRKRQGEIDRLVKAFQDNEGFPGELRCPAETFGGRLDIIRRLVFYHEPKLIPLFLDALEKGDVNQFAETGLLRPE